MKKLAGIVIFGVFLNISAALAGPIVYRCAHAHTPILDLRTKNIVKMLEEAPTGPTDDRIEEKRVVRDTSASELVTQMEASGFVLRDVPPSGKLNVTDTDYLPDHTYYLNGQKLKFKIRFRKYGTVDEKDPQGSWTPISSMRDKSTLEFKIEQPDLKASVKKRQLTVWDSDKMLLANPLAYPKSVEGIRKRLIELNPPTTKLSQKQVERLVDQAMFDFRLRYEEAQSLIASRKATVVSEDGSSRLLKDGVVVGLDVNTRYVRNAFKRDLGNGYEVQITLDSQIMFYDYQSKERFQRYAPNEVVAEIKLPPVYSVITPQMIAENPSLQQVKDVRDKLDTDHLPDYKKDSGKSSSAKSKRPQAIEETVIED
jgi:hypothetical protein